MPDSFEKDFIRTRPNYLKSLRYDAPAGLVVFLVALPLCLGIALASGAPLFSGIIAGVVGGIVVGMVSGAPLGVSGPAAGLTVIVLDAIGKLGFEIFLVAVILAGIFQIILGYAQAGIIGYFFPTSVIKGMLAGIGILLILKQIPHALGDDRDFEGDFGFEQPDGHNTITEIYYSFLHFNQGALIITLFSIGILLLWETGRIRRSWLKNIPAPLFVVVIGTGINVLYSHFFPHLTLFNETSDGGQPNAHLVSIPVFFSFNEFLDLFIHPDFSGLLKPEVYKTALTIAVVGSVETLLSVEAIDKLDPYKRITPTNRELKAQGVGNIISGLLGGLPITQVIVRSSANIASGGRTKMATILHGFFLLACVYFITEYLNMVPLACLAAILLMVGYKLTKVELFVQLFKQGWTQFMPFVATILGILFTDLLKGIAIGTGVAIFYILRSNYRTPFYFKKEEHHEGEVVTIKLSQEVTFLNKASIMIMLEELPPNSVVTIDGSQSNMIDYDVKEIIENFIAHAPLRNIRLKVVNVDGVDQAQVERRIRQSIDPDGIERTPISST